MNFIISIESHMSAGKIYFQCSAHIYIDNKFRKSKKLSRVTTTEQNYPTTEQKVPNSEKKEPTTD